MHWNELALALDPYSPVTNMASAPSSSVDLIELVRKSGLVERDQLDSWLKINPALPGHVHITAAKLVKDGVLTTFHAQHMLTGKYKGFIIGQYKVLEQIGAGGMGVIFLGEHLTMKRRVAIKVLPADRVGDKESLERFYREARVVAALDHPNIVKAHDADQSGNMHFMVMEYIDGESLEHLVRRKGPLPIEEAADYISQAACGLHHANDRGLVHRDIKPGNLLLEKGGIVKILDMGLARFFEDKSTLTVDLGNGAVIGTADYMSPEQAVNSHDVDVRADIYSLGVTYYTLLTGKPPFAAEAVTQKLLAHHMREPAPLAKHRSDVPKELAVVISKMMAKRPEDRFQTPDEIAMALTPWATPRFLPAPSTMRLTATRAHPPVSLPAKKKRRRWLFPTAIAASLIAAGIIIAVVSGGKDGPPNAVVSNDPSKENEPTGPDRQEVPPTREETKQPADLPSRQIGQFIGHKDKVERLAVSPDGKRLVTCGEKSLKLWDVEKALVLHELVGHVNRVVFAAFDRRGERVVSSGVDGTLRIWNVGDGRLLDTLEVPGASFWAAVFTPDGKQIFSCDKAGVALVWDIATKQIAFAMKGHTKDINWIGVSPDGRTGYTASWDGTTRFWDLGTGEEVAQFDKQGANVNSLAVSPDGRYVATSGGSKICLLDSAIGFEVRSYSAPEMKAAYAISFSPDSRLIVAAGLDKTIRVWDVASGNLLDTFGGRTDVVTAVEFVDPKHVVSSSYDKIVRKWALGDALVRYRAPEPPTGELRQYPTGNEQIERLAISPSGNMLAGGSRQGAIRLWDVENGRILHEMPGHSGTVWFVSFSPNGRSLVSSGADGTIRLWNAVTGAETKKIVGPKGSMWSVVFSPDGTQIFSGGDDGIGRIWDVKSGDLVRTCVKHPNTINWVAWSPDGKLVYTAGWDGTVRGWYADDGQQKFAFDQEKRFDLVTVSPDGTMLLCDSGNSKLYLLNAQTGEKVRTLDDSRMAGQWSAMFSRDGLLAVSSGAEKVLRVWDVTTGKAFYMFHGHFDNIPGCVISADGRRVVSSSLDRTVRLWVVPPQR